MPEHLPEGAALMPVPADHLEWMRRGEEFFLARLASITDPELTEPSGLPGWTRAHVVAHVARNADAIGNLLTWARTGVETPMYPSTEARNADIEATSKLDPPALRADVRQASARLVAAAEALPDGAWDA